MNKVLKVFSNSSLFKITAILAVLYLFLVSIGMIGAAFKGLGSGFAKTLFTTQASPFIGLFIGLRVTSVRVN